MAITMVELTCEVCGKSFSRIGSEHTRNAKRKRKTFCNNSCSAVYKNKTLVRSQRQIDEASQRIRDYVAKNGNPKQNDELSPFRKLFQSAKGHAKDKNREFSITLKHLLEQWRKQNGRCVYTGWILEMSENTKNQLVLSPRKMSLDRVDSSGGYTPENIQFVCYMANTAKNRFSEQELIDFCLAVSEHKG